MRQKLASWSKNALNSGMVQNSSIWLTIGPTKRVGGPVTEHLIRQAEFSARCVRGVRHET